MMDTCNSPASELGQSLSVDSSAKRQRSAEGICLGDGAGNALYALCYQVTDDAQKTPISSITRLR